jgi:hypothetical protein
MKTLRRLHLYLGCFFAPLLLFFVLSGWYQTANPERLKSVSEAETWVQKTRVVHTDQIYPGEREVRQPSSPRAFQWLVYGMSAALAATTALGVVLAFRSVRAAWPVWVALGLGLAVPVLLLWLGRGRG